MKRLVIAEKPSVAQSIAAVLGAKERKKGYIEGADCIISWCIGHLVELAPAHMYDESYAKWKQEHLPIVPGAWEYIVSEDTKKQYTILKTLMHRTDIESIVCATDAGREGELIFRLVYNKCGCMKPVKRLWISSLEESAILQGFETLRNGQDYERLYQAALCRAQADWLVGINATRLFSLMYGQTINVGRVMTPTLALLVSREATIAAFVPESFYHAQISCGFIASGERMQERHDAEMIAAACHGGEAVVKSIQSKAKTEKPPKLYDLTTLQRDANRMYGFTAQQTLDYAQSLYEKKLITYPRTESRHLTDDMAASLPDLAKSVENALPFTAGLNLPVNTAQVIDSAKVSDHHAILPTGTMAQSDLASLPGGERDVLYLICVQMLCALGDAHQYEETTAILECAGHSFTAKGTTIKQMGWKIPLETFKGSRQLTDAAKREIVYPLPELKEGQRFSPATATVKEGKTTPPKHYTEDTLLAAMETAGAEDIPDDAERKGLGTPATRAGILEKLVKAGFAERKGDKRTKHLLPTAKGMAVITVLPEQIQSPSMTAEWEQSLKEIERGNTDPTEFMTGITDMLREMIQTVKPIPGAETLFPSGRKRLGTCPCCSSQVTESPKGFFCENRACHFGIWKDNRFFTSQGKTLTVQMVSALLKAGHVYVTGMHSQKTGNTYDADVILEHTLEGKTSFRLEFNQKAKQEKKTKHP